MKFRWWQPITVNEYATNSGSTYGHANAEGASAVGAAFYNETPDFGQSPPLLEYFSSGSDVGGNPILFDTAGNPVDILRQKPDIVAPDGTNNTFLGATLERMLTLNPTSLAPPPPRHTPPPSPP